MKEDKEQELDKKVDEQWQLMKQRHKPQHKIIMCFACGETKDCKAIFICDDCAKTLMKLTEVNPHEWRERVQP